MNHAVAIDAHVQPRRPMKRRPRLLLSACSCSPNWGSEPGVGWWRATELAKYCDVWVLTKQDGMRPRIEAYLEEHGSIPNLEFVYIPRPPWELALARWPFKYIMYRRWLRRAYREAQRLHAEIGFDIAHHVTFNGYREPSYLYRLGIPFVWGPVGGAQNYPSRFLIGADLVGGAFEATRSLLNVIQLHTSRRVRAAAKTAAAIFTANSVNKRKLRQALGADSILMCDAGTPPSEEDDHLRQNTGSHAIRILWAGNLATWKALELLIEALALLPADVAFELHVLGDGPLRQRWERLAERKGISQNVKWFGRVPHEEALEQFRWADVFTFTSLRDTSGNVVLESLVAGKPVICLDHQGVGDIVTPQCGIKIPVTNRRDVAILLSEAIGQLQRNPALRNSLGEGARQRAADYRWSCQAARIAEEYNRILESVGSDARCDLRVASDLENDLWHEAPIDNNSARVQPVES